MVMIMEGTLAGCWTVPDGLLDGLLAVENASLEPWGTTMPKQRRYCYRIISQLRFIFRFTWEAVKLDGIRGTDTRKFGKFRWIFCTLCRRSLEGLGGIRRRRGSRCQVSCGLQPISETPSQPSKHHGVSTISLHQESSERTACSCRHC